MEFTAGRYRARAFAMPSGSGFYGRVEYELIVQGRVVRSDWMEFERRFWKAEGRSPSFQGREASSQPFR